jgi:hypothetical protein
MNKLPFFALLITTLLANCQDNTKLPTCVDGLQNQNETGVDCGGPCVACFEGVHGKWKSAPVAPILTTSADSILAEFKQDGNYELSYWKSGFPSKFTGTFVQVFSGVNPIYAVTLNQKTPSVAVFRGMIQLSDADSIMLYETVQTTPSIGATPPLATEGFGSSKFNGVALGNNNIQSFSRKTR